MELSFIGVLTSFGAGLLTSLSPCVYPMIPITLGFLGRAENQKRDVIAFVLGQALALTALGFVAVSLGEAFGFTSDTPWAQIVVAILMLGMGIFSWKGELPEFMNGWNQFSERARLKLDGIPMLVPGLSALLFGAFSALLASPCSSPILGGILVQVASSGQSLSGLILMLAFASGLSVLFLILGLGVTQGKRLPRAGAWMKRIHVLSSMALVGVGVFYFLQGVRSL